MATVPRVTGPSVEVRPTPFVTQSAEGATPDAFGAAAGRGMVQAGQQLAAFGEQVFRTAERIRWEEDQRAATEAETEFAKRRNTVVRGDGTDQNPGYYGLAGQNAVDGYKGAREALDAARDEIAKNMQSDRARTRFLQRANAQIVAEDNTMLGFVTQNRRVAANATSQAAIATATGEFAGFYNDAERGARQLEIVEAQTRAEAQRNGITDTATVDALVQARRGEAVKAAVNTALERDDVKGAEALFRRYVGTIDPRMESSLANLLRDKVQVEEAQSAARSIFEEGLRRGWTEVEFRRAIDDRFDGKIQDAITARVNQFIGAVDQDKARGQRDLAEANRRSDETAAEASVRLRGLSAEDREKELARFDARTRLLVERNLATFRSQQQEAENAQMTALRREGFRLASEGKDPETFDPAMREAFRTAGEWDSVQRAYARVASGAPVSTDWSAYAEVRQLLADPDTARTVNPNEWRGKLADAQFRDVVNRVSEVQAGRFDQDAKGDIAAVRNKLDQYEFYKKARRTEQERLEGLFLQEIDAVRAVLPGNKISPEDRATLLGQLSARFVQSGYREFLGFELPFRRTPTENEAAVEQAQTFRGPERVAIFFARQREATAARLQLPPNVLDDADFGGAAAGRIPPQIRAQIVSALRERRITSPSEADIRFMYALGIKTNRIQVQ
jgi:hypothetical protein